MPVLRQRTVAQNIAELLSETTRPVHNQEFEVLGFYAANDGGGDVFRYDANSTEAVDGMVMPGIGGSVSWSDNFGLFTGGSGSGRFVRVGQGALSPMSLGAVGDGVANDQPAIQAALNTGKDIRFTEGKTHLVNHSVRVETEGQRVDGQGAKLLLNSDSLNRTIYLNADDIIVQNLEIDGNADVITTASGRHDGIGVYGNNCAVIDSYIHDYCARSGMSLVYVASTAGMDYFRMEGCRLENSGYCLIRPDAKRVDLINNVLWYSQNRAGYEHRTVNSNRCGGTIRWTGGICGADAGYTGEVFFLFDLEGQSTTAEAGSRVVIDGVRFDAPDVVTGPISQAGKFESVANVEIRNVTSNINQPRFALFSTQTSDDASVTFDSGADTATSAGHGMEVGHRVLFTSTGTLPAGLSASTPYFVTNVTDDTFQVQLEPYGDPASVVAFVDDGTGAHTLLRCPRFETLTVENCNFFGGLYGPSAGTRGTFKTIRITDCVIRDSYGLISGWNGAGDIEIENVELTVSAGGGLIASGSMDEFKSIVIRGLKFISTSASTSYIFSTSDIPSTLPDRVFVNDLEIYEAGSGKVYLSNSCDTRLLYTWDGEAYYYNPLQSRFYGEPIGTRIGVQGDRLGTRTTSASQSSAQFRSHYGSSGYDQGDAFPGLSSALASTGEPEKYYGRKVVNTAYPESGPPAWYFDGVDFIEESAFIDLQNRVIGNDSNILEGATEWTIACRCKPYTLPSQASPLLGDRVSGKAILPSLCYHDPSAAWYIVQASTASLPYDISVIFSDAPVIGEEQHVACTYDGTDVKLYVNGVESPVSSAPNLASGATVGVGRARINEGIVGPFGTVANWDGTVRDVFVRRRALTADEVSALYHGVY